MGDGKPFAERTCVPCRGDARPFTEGEVRMILTQVPLWRLEEGRLARDFSFKGYDETLGFVEDVAALAKREDHHPEVTFGYKTCRVTWTTHAIRGLSENDFICAAKVNELRVE